MLQVQLTEGQKNNLVSLLQRVELKGAEVPAYVEILNALMDAKEDSNNNITD